jgi:hypothetical protein
MTAAIPNFASLLRPFIPLDFVNPFIIRTEHPAKVRFLDSGGVHRTPETRDANPERALVPSAVEGSRAEGSRLPVKAFTIRTSEKSARNPFTIRTSKTQDLKPFRIRTYKKKDFFSFITVNQIPGRESVATIEERARFIVPYKKAGPPQKAAPTKARGGATRLVRAAARYILRPFRRNNV